MRRVLSITIAAALVASMCVPTALASPSKPHPDAASPKANKHANPLAVRALLEAERGKPAFRHGRMRPNNKRFDNILTLLVEFAGEDVDAEGITHVGPLHNQMEAPAVGDNTTYWVPDFSPAHYGKMLFDPAPGAKSMTNFFLEQSGGLYGVDGQVTQWVQLPHSEWYYGADSVAGGDGSDNLNGPVWRMVADAVKAAGTSVNWAKFDQEDPYDFDGDGNYAEPDGYVDHIQVIHAGADQAGDGGAQGTDAIWSHSWYVDYGSGEGPYGMGGVETAAPGVWVGAYTTDPEDGTVGVFTHEFSHDLGLPDQYDTAYTGEASNGFWTLMSSGSWLGDAGTALGTSPSGWSAWEKYVMGWLDPTVINPGQRKKGITLRDATSSGKAGKAIRVSLPGYDYVENVGSPHSGDYFWYSDAGDMLNNTLTRSDVAVPDADGLQLRMWVNYDIEADWDYGYVEVSTDGVNFTTLPGSLTTDTNPNGNNDGFGLTGVSGGWVETTYDLSAYRGRTVALRFRYETDEAMAMPGWQIDDVVLDSADGTIALTDAETDDPAWAADGFLRTTGTAVGTASHYYLAEWRQPSGFETSMDNWYNLVDGDTAEFFGATPGMLLWYRNLRFGDNLFTSHPWAGQLLLVDSHPQLLTAADSAPIGNELWGWGDLELPWRTRIQLADATFGLGKTKPFTVSSWWQAFDLPTSVPAQNAVATFDDSKNWVDKTYQPWFDADLGLQYFLTAAVPSVDTPSYGLKISVTAAKQSAATVDADFSGYRP